MSPDHLNFLFELLASPFLFLHVRRVWKDRDVAGASVVACAFFTAWGWWNLYFYPAMGLWWSFWGGVPVLVMNCLWLAGMIRFRRRVCGTCGEADVTVSGGYCEPCWSRVADAYAGTGLRPRKGETVLGPYPTAMKDGRPVVNRRPCRGIPGAEIPDTRRMSRPEFRFDKVSESATMAELEARIPETLSALRRRRGHLEELIQVKEVMEASRALKAAMRENGGRLARDESESLEEADERGDGGES